MKETKDLFPELTEKARKGVAKAMEKYQRLARFPGQVLRLPCILGPEAIVDWYETNGKECFFCYNVEFYSGGRKRIKQCNIRMAP